MSGLQRAKAVFLKEVVDNARDRKAWAMALLYVVIGPLMLVGVIFMAERLIADERARVVELPVVGDDRAPSLIEYIKQRNIVPLPTHDDPERMIRDQHRPAVLVISPEYAHELANGRPGTVQLYHDSSQRADASMVHRVREALYGFGLSVGHLRLLARGVNPAVVSGLAVEVADLATPHSRAAFLFDAIPIFLLMALFVGGMYIAIDTTAGERERGSLEPLLINPLRPVEIIGGKFAAVAAFTTATVFLSIAGFALVLNVVTVDIPDVRIELSAGGVGWMVAILVPAVVLASALQMRLASRGRTFREAQTSAQFLMLLPAIPGLMKLMGAAQGTALQWVPIFGQHLLIERILKHESFTWGEYGLSTLATLALGGVVLLDTARRYERSKVLFG